MNQEQRHPDGVVPHQHLASPGQSTRGEANEQVAHVVGVSRQPPPTAAEEQARMLLAICCRIRCCDDLGRFAPDEALAAGTTDTVLLVVDGTEDGVTCKADAEEECLSGHRRRRGIQAEVLTLDRVHGWQVTEAAPSKVKAIVIMGNVNGAQVP